jgi:hypothetical protein
VAEEFAWRDLRSFFPKARGRTGWVNRDGRIFERCPGRRKIPAGLQAKADDVKVPIMISLAATALILAPAAASAEDLPERVENVVVYGDDPCPKAQGDDIVVCGRKPETERYRIPKELRRNRDERRGAAWATRVAELEEATRFTKPNSCSVVGSWGQTGCLEAAIRNWVGERRAMKARR